MEAVSTAFARYNDAAEIGSIRLEGYRRSTPIILRISRPGKHFPGMLVWKTCRSRSISWQSFPYGTSKTPNINSGISLSGIGRK